MQVEPKTSAQPAAADGASGPEQVAADEARDKTAAAGSDTPLPDAKVCMDAVSSAQWTCETQKTCQVRLMCSVIGGERGCDDNRDAKTLS